MLLITKELAEAIIKAYTYVDFEGDSCCAHCYACLSFQEHEDNCIVTHAKLLLEKRMGYQMNTNNKDLEAAYEMGYKAAVANAFWKGCNDDDIETQDYADQRHSDLKELASFDRS